MLFCSKIRYFKRFSVFRVGAKAERPLQEESGITQHSHVEKPVQPVIRNSSQIIIIKKEQQALKRGEISSNLYFK